jgi:hypothetical protein
MTALAALAALLNRHDGFPPQSKATLRRLMSPAIARADAEFDALYERVRRQHARSLAFVATTA